MKINLRENEINSNSFTHFYLKAISQSVKLCLYSHFRALIIINVYRDHCFFIYVHDLFDILLIVLLNGTMEYLMVLMYILLTSLVSADTNSQNRKF